MTPNWDRLTKMMEEEGFVSPSRGDTWDAVAEKILRYIEHLKLEKDL